MNSAPRIAVGSTNPVKIAAVRTVFAHFVPGAVVEAVAAASGVADQPFGDEETKRGAWNRATAARKRLSADYGVGLEGGVVEEADGTLRTCAWACVVDATGRRAFGGSLVMPLPAEVARLVRSGVELGPAMDALTGRVGVKHAEGAVGILTRGFVDRRRAYEPLVAYACAGIFDAG